MSLTSIGDQKTPGRPIELTFDAETGIPSSDQELLLIGHRSASGPSGTATTYQVVSITNAADSAAAKTEAEGLFGESELSKMVVAAIEAIEKTGGSTFPGIKCMPLASDDVGFGAADVALTNARGTKAEFIVSPYDGDDATLRGKLKDHAALLSGATRADNGQYGSFGVVGNHDSAVGSLPTIDTQHIIGCYLRDTSERTMVVGEFAAACAAMMAGNVAPFNPLDNKTVGGIAAPALVADYLTVGAGLESETALDKGWTPLRVKTNGEVAFVRTVTSRITTGDSVTEVSSYQDVQDFQVLYLWRKTVATRLKQSDMTNVKASADKGKQIKSELIRLAGAFEDQNMFQAVEKLAKEFKVERNGSDRSRFDVLTPVNVIPGLHTVATNVKATTKYDVVTV